MKVETERGMETEAELRAERHTPPVSVPIEHEPVPPDAAALRAAVEQARSAVRADLLNMRAGGELLGELSERILELITPTCARAVGRAEGAFGKLAIVVVGGLARSEHCPHSDIDLTVLCTDPPEEGGEGDEAFARWMAELNHPLWDAGLRLRTTVHRPQIWLDAAVEDLRLCTALLDVRLVAGDRQIVEDLGREAHRRFFGSQRANFLQRLIDEANGRERRYGTTVYQVEPDLKFGPGGTRDLAIVEWALMARRPSPEPWDASKIRSAMRAAGTPRRVAVSLARARDMLLRLRAALHLVAGRTQDRLHFQYQEGVPALLGRVTPPAEGERIEDAVLVAAIEACMQDYYRAARDVRRYGLRVFARCQPPRAAAELHQRIDERFYTLDDRLYTYGKAPFASSPVLGLEALLIARDRNLQPSGTTLDGLLDATAAIPEGDRRLAEDPAAQARFMNLLVDPRDTGSPSPLEQVHDLGYLERLVPEFAASRGRMQHEGFHVYTVDQHSLYAVEFLKAVARGNYRRDYPMATAVHLSVEEPATLYLATLLHDAGKAFGDQCTEGARIAELAAIRAGLSAAEVGRCGLLVREHQTMPMLSQKRDLSDELLVREFAALVGDRRTLDELYLVSLADMANVSPDYLTSWKLSLLDELYLRAAAELASGRRRAAAVVVRRPQEDEPEGLPERYYSLFDRELRGAHRVLLDTLLESDAPAIVDVAEGVGALRVTVATPDRPGLLAVLTGCFARLGLTVMAADVFSVPGQQGRALDVFRVAADRGVDSASKRHRHRGGGNAQDVVAEHKAELEGAFAEALRSAPSAAELAEPLPPLPRTRRGRRRRTPTRVRFSEDPGRLRTIVDVETVESPDVAARITRAFAALGLDIEIARINTEMRRVDAVFYVPKLDERARGALAKAIRANLRTRRR